MELKFTENNTEAQIIFSDGTETPFYEKEKLLVIIRKLWQQKTISDDEFLDLQQEAKKMKDPDVYNPSFEFLENVELGIVPQILSAALDKVLGNTELATTIKEKIKTLNDVQFYECTDCVEDGEGIILPKHAHFYIKNNGMSLGLICHSRDDALKVLKFLSDILTSKTDFKQVDRLTCEIEEVFPI